MRASLSTLNLGAVSPNLLGFFKAAAYNSVRAAITADTPAAMTDNSTGNNAASVAVPLINTRAVPAGANLASRPAFNAAIVTAHNAIAVLVDTLNDFYTALGIDTELGAHDGVVAVAGTVPAVTKAITGVDGTAGNGMLRSEANAALSLQRNNLATTIKAYNRIATAMGAATIPNNTGGKADANLTFGAAVAADTAVAAGAVATSDLAAKADADASMTALANDIAHVTNNVNTVLRAAGSLVPEPIIIEP
jgi:hypothetical protein